MLEHSTFDFLLLYLDDIYTSTWLRREKQKGKETKNTGYLHGCGSAKKSERKRLTIIIFALITAYCSLPCYRTGDQAGVN